MFDDLLDGFDRDRDRHRPQRRSGLRGLIDRLFGRSHDDNRAYRHRRPYDDDDDSIHPAYDARRRRYDDDDDDDDDHYVRSGRRGQRSRFDWDD